MNSFPPSERMKAVKMPPIADIMRRVSELKSSGKRIYSMAQATPWYSPPSGVLDDFAQKIKEPFLHGYSPDPGFPWARKAVAEDFRIRRQIDLDPGNEIQLTCGASQAFLSALLTVSSPGDSVAVIEPYYFDHVFAVKFSGLGLRSIPMAEYNGRWLMPLEDLKRVLPEVSALVIVNPGNPTGTVIPDSVLMQIAGMTADTGTFLIIDETYERFVFTEDSWHPWQDEHGRHVLTLGSFSKSLGMPGWRLGYLFGSADLLEQTIKVQDSVVICPPSPSQYLLERALGEREWISEMSNGIKTRLELCRAALKNNTSLSWRESGGGFFTLAAYKGNMPSMDAALYLLDEYGIGTIPGSAFGESGEGHLRISFGCLSDEELEPAMKLLSEVSFP